MSRKSDRKHAFCLIFQLDFNKIDINEALDYYLNNYAEEPASEMDFIIDEIQGVYNNLDIIDKYISQTSAAWDFSRLSKVDLAIMRLATYEIIYENKIDASISINEAVELAKMFSSEDAGKFVNGILGKIVRELDVNES